VDLDQTGLELILPSGARLGHRSLQRYFKQRFRNTDEPESVIIARMASHYRELGWSTMEVTTVQKAQDRHRRHAESDFSLRVGTNANRLQRYFRPQVDF
jgi:pre-60S factor REI1